VQMRAYCICTRGRGSRLRHFLRFGWFGWFGWFAWFGGFARFGGFGIPVLAVLPVLVAGPGLAQIHLVESAGLIDAGQLPGDGCISHDDGPLAYLAPGARRMNMDRREAWYRQQMPVPAGMS
jgi:hypothetical protein